MVYSYGRNLPGHFMVKYNYYQAYMLYKYDGGKYREHRLLLFCGCGARVSKSQSIDVNMI